MGKKKVSGAMYRVMSCREVLVRGRGGASRNGVSKNKRKTEQQTLLRQVRLASIDPSEIGDLSIELTIDEYSEDGERRGRKLKRIQVPDLTPASNVTAMAQRIVVRPTSCSVVLIFFSVSNPCGVCVCGATGRE
jgi:hypothetical protein